MEIINTDKKITLQEKEKREEELIAANIELALQSEGIHRRALDLDLANKELVFQNEEKEKRAAELIIANNELAFQNKEKQRRAEELVIANAELAFQNIEKQKRAEELAVANRELAIQNEEKHKRALELILANKELVFQNEEKEKRAAELIIANKELAFQNEEKQKRAEELVLANKELVFQNKEKEKRAAELMEEKENRAAELLFSNKELLFQNEEKERKAGQLIERTAQLESVNSELDSFSYSVSHDLRAPLRAVHGYAKILHEDYGPQFDAEANRLMNSIMSNAKKMGQLIDDLLTFSRLGRKELIKVNINMQDMVTTLCNELSDEGKHRIIQFNTEIISADGDTATIRQVWQNLINNAIKYSGQMEKSIIEISSRAEGDEVIYCIKDNGVGFDMRYSNKLFGVFQRLHSNDQFEGTGVGLAIVHRIISKHGGRVWAEGKVKEGAVFYFSLPINA